MGHCLRRRARLGDDVEHSLFYVDYVQKRFHSLRIDVVFYIKLRSLALTLGQIVVVHMAYCLKSRDRSKRASADAEYDEILKVLAYILCRLYNIFDDCVLIVRQICPTHHTFAFTLLNRIKSLVKFLFESVDILVGITLFANHGLHHIVVVHSQFHSLFAITHKHLPSTFMIGLYYFQYIRARYITPCPDIPKDSNMPLLNRRRPYSPWHILPSDIHRRTRRLLIS